MNSCRLRRLATFAPYLLVPVVATGVIITSGVYNSKKRRPVPPILSWQDAINNLNADHRVEESLCYLEKSIILDGDGDSKG